jgi:hypothetical protein
MPYSVATETGHAELLERVHSTIELLTAIAADRSVLAGVPVEDRRRLLESVALVYSPDRVERRRMAKIAARKRKAARVRQDEGVLAETGIRALRRRPVVHTPNVFPPEDSSKEMSSRIGSRLAKAQGSPSPATSASRNTRRFITSMTSCARRARS